MNFSRLALVILLIVQFSNDCCSQTDWEIDETNAIIGVSFFGAGFLTAIVQLFDSYPKPLRISNLEKCKFPIHAEKKFAKIVPTKFLFKADGTKQILDYGTVSIVEDYYGKFNKFGGESYITGKDTFKINDRNYSVKYYNLKDESDYHGRKKLKALISFTSMGVGCLFMGASFKEVPVEIDTGPGIEEGAKAGRILLYTIGGGLLLGGIINYINDHKTQFAWNYYKRQNKSAVSIKLSPTILKSGNKFSSNKKYFYSPGFSFSLTF